ncbi:MAG: hypothetical protein CSB44_06090 [Gammaproteobacteria bacterium]|nr:MAG: hypothetical protein CSB44_06090 [Gammaproteobacteria bacterium]PIE37673.1 MAG: hypothetical protein CSA54_00970 [Gammaproteobacteria bacterium]
MLSGAPVKIQSPTQLLQLVMLCFGMDLSLRRCAGEVSHHQGCISDTAVAGRLGGCVEWLGSLLAGVPGFDASPTDTGRLRFLLIDGSTVQTPGATGTSWRLHIAMNLIEQRLQQVALTNEKKGEGLEHFSLDSGDVVVLDRACNQPKSLVPFIERGGSVLLRCNPMR